MSLVLGVGSVGIGRFESRLEKNLGVGTLVLPQRLVMRFYLQAARLLTSALRDGCCLVELGGSSSHL